MKDEILESFQAMGVEGVKTFKLIKFNNTFMIKRDIFLLHLCETIEEAKNKFDRIYDMLNQDNKIVKGGEKNAISER